MEKLALPKLGDFCTSLKMASAYLVAGLILLNVFAFGGTAGWALLTSHFLILTAFLLQLPLIFLEPDYWNDFPPRFRVFVLFFSAFLAFAAIQAFLGPQGVLERLIGTAGRYVTFESAVELVFYFAFFVAAVKTASQRRQLEVITALLGLSAFCAGMLGIAQKMSGNRLMYWAIDVGGDRFFGPFVYENSFGAFVGLTLPMILGTAVYRYVRAFRQWKASEPTNPRAFFPELLNSGFFLFSFAAAITFAATLYSESRASTLIILICFVASLFLVFSGRASKTLYLVIAGLVAATFVLAVVQLDLGKILQHYGFSELASTTEFRIRLWRSSFDMFKDRALFGWGLGSFPLVAPKYLTIPTESWSYVHANNDYLELLTESGLLGFALMALAVVSITGFSIKSLLGQKSVWIKIMGLQALFSLAAIAAMITTDAHTKLPAIALLVILQLAAFSQVVRSDYGSRKAGTGKTSFQAKAVSSLVLIAVSIFLLNHALHERNIVVSSAGQGDRAYLEKQTLIEPQNAENWRRLAETRYKKMAFQIRRKNDLDASPVLSAARRARDLNPTYPFYWFMLGELEYVYGDKHQGIECLKTAVRWSPANRLYACFLISVYLRERDRVLSSTKKDEYWNKALELYRSVQKLRYPPTDAEFTTWMFYRDTGVLGDLKRAAGAPIS